MEAYRKATEKQYEYLLVDLSPHSDPKYKLRTHTLPYQSMIVYAPDKETWTHWKKTQGDFLRLLLSTSDKQRHALLNTIQTAQLRAVVQIVYNVLMGNRDLSNSDTKRLKKHKIVIRRFISKGLSVEERKRILRKYIQPILQIIKVVQEEL